MKINLPHYVTTLIQRLEENGYECFVVGGAVRSSLLNLPIHDYDMTTSALPEEMKQVFQDYPTIETGLKHGTLTVLSNHHPIEITTYRKDATYKDHRHPDEVIFTRAIQEDCARRDFTVNALCYNPRVGILDFFHGEEDMHDHKIRCIGDPFQRFEEDALRILRAIRFASRLHFTIEENTSKALLSLSPTLRYISIERIQQEFDGYLGSIDCANFFLPYRKVFEVFLPELKEESDTDIAVLVEAFHHSPCNSILRMALILSLPVFNDPRSVLRRLKYSNNDMRTILDLISHKDCPLSTKIELKETLSTLSCPWDIYFAYRCALERQDDPQVSSLYQEIIHKQECFCLKDLAIKGNDLIQLGYQGKEISTTLHTLLQKVIHEQLPNDHTTLYTHAKNHIL